jgi:signal transduction histidine kinase
VTGKVGNHFSFIILLNLSINQSNTHLKISFNSHIKPVLIYLTKVLILAIVYHLAARLGLQMAYVQANTSPVWPPTGIGLAALLLFGAKLWPGISLGVLFGSLLTGAPLNLALGLAVGNTIEALLAVFILKRVFNLRNELDRIQDVIALVVVSLFCTTIAATVGSMTLMLLGFSQWQNFWSIWFTWWIGDLLGALVITPLLLTWLSPNSIHPQKRLYVEGGILLVILALTTWYVFSSMPPIGVFHQAMIYVIFPFVIWAALRFGQRGATFAITMVSGIAIWGTSQGMGPFSLESKNDSLVLLQTFTAVVSLTALILAAATIERRKAADALRQKAEELAILNESSKTFLDNFEIANIFQIISRLAVTRLGSDIAWVETRDKYDGDDKDVHGYGISNELLQKLTDKLPDTEEYKDTPASMVLNLDFPSIRQDIDLSAFRTYATFPLIFSSQLIGTLRLVSRKKDFFSSDNQLLFQSYANLAAVAIQNTLLFEEVRRSNKQLHGLSQRLMKAQEEERLHLSRELHDESGQLLTALTVQLGLLDRTLDHPEAMREKIEELKNTANEIQENLHQLAVNLRPASLDHIGLVTTLQQFITEFNRQYHFSVDFEAVGMEGRRLPGDIETTVFRIVQESLTNVILHSQANHVEVLISLFNQNVILIVEDDGIGFIPTTTGTEDHLGLFGMRERVEMLGGSFLIESTPGKGTTIKAEIPCDG